MARRQLLNDVQWAGLLLPPSDEREIIRHSTKTLLLPPASAAITIASASR